MNIRGIDTMYFGLDILDYKEKYNGVLVELKEKKDLGHELGVEQSVIYNNIRFNVALTGIRFYAYLLKCKDYTIAFAERPTATNSEIMVRFNSNFLWSYGYKEAYKRFIEWFNYFPGVIQGSRLSRLDICIDTDEIKFEEADKSLFITRAKDKKIRFADDEHYNCKKFTGFTVGRGNPMMVRIYNKTIEINKSGKEWFKTVWKENGWQGQKDVWRIEYQLRRGVLKELEIDSVEELAEKENGLWVYLTTKWFRINHDKWKKVQRSKETAGSPLIRKKVIQGDITRLTRQTNGLLISIGAFANITDLFDVINYVMENIQQQLQTRKTSFSMEVQKRQERYFS